MNLKQILLITIIFQISLSYIKKIKRKKYENHQLRILAKKKYIKILETPKNSKKTTIITLPILKTLISQGHKKKLRKLFLHNGFKILLQKYKNSNRSKMKEGEKKNR